MRDPHKLSQLKKTTRPTRVLFFDTETVQKRVHKTRIDHNLRLGYAVFCRTRRGEKLRVQSEINFLQVDEFWDWVDLRVSSKSRLIMVAHNLNFDLPVLKAFSELPARGWTATGFYTKGTVNIFRWVNEDRKITILDNGNFFQGRLEDWGKRVGLPKVQVDFDTVEDDQLLERCKADVEIMRRLWITLLDFLDDHDLGKFGVTLASTAFNSYRYRFMPATIYISDDLVATALERDAYRGARVECLFQGESNSSNYHYIDVNAMYAYVMRENLFPAGLFDARPCKNLDILDRKLDSYCVIAHVLVNVDKNPFPLKIDEVSVYPLGRFWTTLTTPELLMARENNWIEEIRYISWYRPAPIFREYVDYFTDLKSTYASAGNLQWSNIAKLFVNALYGKFGQRGLFQERVGSIDASIVKREEVYDEVEGRYYHITMIGGSVIKEYRIGESYNSFPGIAAHVTAYARLYHFWLMSLIPKGHCYYVDNDSLIVDDLGLEYVRDLLDDHEPGKIKIELSSPWLTINAPKDYAMEGRSRLKGIRPDARLIKPDQYFQHRWKRIPGLISDGDLDQYYIEPSIKTLARRIRSGFLLPDGWVAPFFFSGSESVLPAPLSVDLSPSP